LVCTKTRRTYERRCDEYRKDVAALAEMADTIQAAAGPLKKIASVRSQLAKWSP
jgi:hypothetical protein